MRTLSHPYLPPRSAGGWRRLAALALATLLGTGAFAAAPLSVTVSIAPYANIVERIGGEHVEVSTLLPPGASPHAFDPTPSQAAGLARSDLIVMNGGLDAWLDRLVAAAAPTVPLVVILDSIEFTPQEEHEHPAEAAGGQERDDHGLSTVNPHVWLDPTLMIQAAGVIAEKLATLDPANAAAYAAGLVHLEGDLRALDAEIATTLAPVRDAPFVPFHDAWPYFAKHYGLDLVLTLEPFPGREPSPKYIADAVATVRRVGAKAVFGERQLSSRSAEVVAESAGVRVMVLDPIGGAPGPVTYEQLLRFNASIILAALK